VKYGWRLDSNYWQDLRNEIDGLTWKRLYLEKDYAPQVPSSPGVYLICASAKDIPIKGQVMERLYNALYAGQSINLHRRFGDHLRGYGSVLKAKSAFRRLDFWYSELPKTRLSEIEQLLLVAFGPTANVNNVKAKIGNPVPAGQNRRTT